MGTAYRRFIASGTVFRTIFFIRISPLALFFYFFYFFFIFLFVFIASVLLVSGNLVLSFLSGKHSSTVVHTNSLSSLDFSFIYHNTTWLDPGPGIWMHLQLGRDLIQAACFLWPFSFRHLWFSRKRRTRSNARRSALVRDRNFSADSSLISPGLSFSFFSPCFLYLFGLERLLGRYPYKQGRHTTDTHFASFFGLLPDSRRYYFNDDLFYDSMTNDYFFSDMIRFTSGITNNRLDVET